MQSNIGRFFSRLSNSPAVSSLNRRLDSIPFISKIPRRAFWIALAVLALAGAGTFGYSRLTGAQAQEADEAELQTAVARRGDLMIYASGTGTLISADEADLAFKTGGQVTGIAVEVGDQVEAGDLLATVDDAEAQLAYTQAERALRELTSPSAVAAAQTAMAEAEADLLSAKGHRTYILGPNLVYWEAEVAEAEAALAAARATAETAPNDAEKQEALKKAEDVLDYMNDRLEGAWISYYEIYIPNNFTFKNQFTGQKYVSAPTDADILSARADVAAAEAAVQEAGWLYAALTGEPVPDDATGSGLTEIEQTRLDLEAAQAELDGTRLLAPFSGTIMSIDTGVGDTVSSGAAVMTIADLSQPYLEVFLDESDWSSIAAGYEAEATFDILPDNVFPGTVTQVDPGLYTESGTSVVRALVRLDPAALAQVNLPLGTAASVDVIGGRAENAVLVPVEAVHQAGDRYTVFVVDDGQPRLRVVEIGLQDLLYVEITSGLEAGEIVTTGIAETQ